MFEEIPYKFLVVPWEILIRNLESFREGFMDEISEVICGAISVGIPG